MIAQGLAILGRHENADIEHISADVLTSKVRGPADHVELQRRIKELVAASARKIKVRVVSKKEEGEKQVPEESEGD